jgi:hypothetical protein
MKEFGQAFQQGRFEVLQNWNDGFESFLEGLVELCYVFSPCQKDVSGKHIQ